MEGLTTFPFRFWVHLASQPGFMTTPFLRVTRVHPEREIPADFAPELYELRSVLPYQVVPQFITGDHLQVLRAAELLPEAVSPVLELNCGCPSPNALGKFAGSGMLHDPEVFGRQIEELATKLGAGRLAVKMRLGLERHDEFPALLESIASLPLARLTIHGRTRDDGYRGQANWNAVRSATTRTRIPVHASGDVVSYESLGRLLTIAPAIQGVMVGRGAMRNPWIFSECRSGEAVRLPLGALIQALFSYALIQDLWHKHPARLIARIQSGRLPAACGTDEQSWERLATDLSNLGLGLPFLMDKNNAELASGLSSVAFSRLKILWAYLRTNVPEELDSAKLMRAKSAAEFFTMLLKLTEGWGEIPLVIRAQESS